MYEVLHERGKVMDDQAIITLFNQRSQHAIAETENRYGQLCNSIAYNILGNKEDAEECVNDVWLSAWNSIPPQQPSCLLAYLGRITRNIALNRHKAKKAIKRGNGELPIIWEEIAEFVSSEYSIESEMEYGELLQHLNCFLQTLPSIERNVFLRRYWFADSIKEIAVRYGFSIGRVKSMLYNTRNHLKASLTQEEIIP